MKVYIPTMEELIELQKLGIDVYSYLVAKVTETIIMETRIYDEGDMFEILNYLGDHPEITYAICRIYPDMIKESIITSKDPKLCKQLIERISKEDKTIYKLDDILMNFDESILFDEGIIKSTINFLSSHLSYCPKYRFDYQGPNELLDNIFSCELPVSKISHDSYDNIMIIDPIYSVKLGIKPKSKKDEEKYFAIKRAMAIYTGRYGISNLLDERYQNKDIINKPDEKVKRLIKTLEYHKKNYQ